MEKGTECLCCSRTTEEGLAPCESCTFNLHCILIVALDSGICARGRALVVALVRGLDILYVQFHSIVGGSPQQDVAPLQPLLVQLCREAHFPGAGELHEAAPRRGEAPVKVLLAGAIVVADVAGDHQLGAHHPNQAARRDSHHAPATDGCNERE